MKPIHKYSNGLFLKKNNLAHYAELAHRIQARIREDGEKGTNFFNSGPFKIDD